MIGRVNEKDVEGNKEKTEEERKLRIVQNQVQI